MFVCESICVYECFRCPHMHPHEAYSKGWLPSFHPKGERHKLVCESEEDGLAGNDTYNGDDDNNSNGVLDGRTKWNLKPAQVPDIPQLSMGGG